MMVSDALIHLKKNKTTRRKDRGFVFPEVTPSEGTSGLHLSVHLRRSPLRNPQASPDQVVPPWNPRLRRKRRTQFLEIPFSKNVGSSASSDPTRNSRQKPPAPNPLNLPGGHNPEFWGPQNFRRGGQNRRFWGPKSTIFGPKMTIFGPKIGPKSTILGPDFVPKSSIPGRFTEFRAPKIVDFGAKFRPFFGPGGQNRRFWPPRDDFVGHCPGILGGFWKSPGEPTRPRNFPGGHSYGRWGKNPP
jgi:hypothetical protein